MGQSWTSLYFAGVKLTEEQYEDIPYPNLEITYHVTDKCFQAGCILGTISGTVATLFKAKNRNMDGFVRNITRYGTGLALLGICIGPVMTYARLRNCSPESIVDRCYRLRHNKSQVKIDQAANMGFVAGPIVSKCFGHPLLFGMVLGVAGNIIGMSVVNSREPPAKL